MARDKRVSAETGLFSLVICKVSSSVFWALGVTRLQPPSTPLMEVEEKGNVVTWKVEYYARLTTVCDLLRHLAVRHSVRG